MPLFLTGNDVHGRPWISPIRPHNPLVAGSSPARPTTHEGVTRPQEPNGNRVRLAAGTQVASHATKIVIHTPHDLLGPLVGGFEQVQVPLASSRACGATSMSSMLVPFAGLDRCARRHTCSMRDVGARGLVASRGGGHPQELGFCQRRLGCGLNSFQAVEGLATVHR